MSSSTCMASISTGSLRNFWGFMVAFLGMGKPATVGRAERVGLGSFSCEEMTFHRLAGGFLAPISERVEECQDPQSRRGLRIIRILAVVYRVDPVGGGPTIFEPVPDLVGVCVVA